MWKKVNCYVNRNAFVKLLLQNPTFWYTCPKRLFWKKPM